MYRLLSRVIEKHFWRQLFAWIVLLNWVTTSVRKIRPRAELSYTSYWVATSVSKKNTTTCRTKLHEATVLVRTCGTCMHVRVVYMYKYRYMYTSVHACTCVCTFLYVHVYTGAILKKGSENLLPVLAVYTYVLHSAVIKQKLNFIDPLLLSMQTFLKLSIYDFGHCN